MDALKGVLGEIPAIKRVRTRGRRTAVGEQFEALLVEPVHGKAHRELAALSYPGVSVGQAHKVATRLLEQGFLLRQGRLFRKEPSLVVWDANELLREWAAAYRFGRSQMRRYYTTTGIEGLVEFSHFFSGPTRRRARRGALASFSAAEVLAAHVRQHRFYLCFVEEKGYGPVEEWFRRSKIALRPVASGENVVILTPHDEGVLYPAPYGYPTTWQVQTYLDLMASPARCEEAAAAVFDRYLKEEATA